MEQLTAVFAFGIAIGVWFGTGLAPCMLVWIKNPEEPIYWKVFHSVSCLAQGPLGFATMEHWLDDTTYRREETDPKKKEH